MRTQAEGSTMRIMLTYTVLMVALPLSTYFGSKHLMDVAGIESSPLYAAGAAIVAVHVVLVLFVYTAWNEDKKEVKTD